MVICQEFVFKAKVVQCNAMFLFYFFITIALNLIGMSKYCIVTKIN